MAKSKFGIVEIIGLSIIGLVVAPFILPVIIFVVLILFLAGGTKVLRILSGADDDRDRPG